MVSSLPTLSFMQYVKPQCYDSMPICTTIPPTRNVKKFFIKVFNKFRNFPSFDSFLFHFLVFHFLVERKGSKASITNSDEIVVDTQTTPKVTTVHEENEKTGETTDVSDK